MLSLTFVLALTGLGAGQAFIVEPYVQLGAHPPDSRKVELDLLWQSASSGSKWQLQYFRGTSAKLSYTRPFEKKARGIPGSFFRASFEGLTPGSMFKYQLYKDGHLVFSSKAKAPKSPSQDYSAVIFGDFGDGGREEVAVAKQAYLRNPDLAVIPGDIVYPKGRLSEFRERLFPVLNSSEAPLMRSTPVVASLGNHDVAAAGEGEGMAYFYLFSVPRNGPAHQYKVSSSVRQLAGSNFERSGSYSFEYGNSLWVGLDSNPDVDWNSAPFKAWLEGTLKKAKSKWKFVFFHHPPFHSSIRHKGDTWMKTLAPLFSKYGVSVVFNGHVHNYQRSKPIFARKDGQELDLRFNGTNRSKTRGTIYLVTGGGGAELYDLRQEQSKATWQAFTQVFKATHSFTYLRIRESLATFQQVDTSGHVIDSFNLRNSNSKTP